MGSHTDPPKQLTVREVTFIVLVAVVLFGAMGLIIGDWQMAIGLGISVTGSQLIHQWWWRRTGQPEYEDEETGE
ncbi:MULTISPECIES: hypothetical protein [unclassified Streptomyces]|uniref:hypothetical protein n=1 Tax=unclassified Streptomyces TaxID=2593676 RepID=UPI00278C117F|nr:MULTISPECIES: hypothetical protein [unclassified Streptomyces]